MNNFCKNCGIKLNENYKYCTNCGMNTKSVFDFDKFFSELGSDTMAYLKNENMLTEYGKLKSSNWKNNDIIWSLYNKIKNKYEKTNDLYALANILNKMSNLLLRENKISTGLEFKYSYYYCIELVKFNTFNKFDFGTTRLRELNNILNKTHIEFTYKDFYSSVLNIIPNKYDEIICNKIFRNIYEQINNKL